MNTENVSALRNTILVNETLVNSCLGRLEALEGSLDKLSTELEKYKSMMTIETKEVQNENAEVSTETTVKFTSIPTYISFSTSLNIQSLIKESSSANTITFKPSLSA